MVAIGGVVPLADTLKQVHQTMDSVAIMKPVTKYSVSIPTPDAAGEAVVNAFRAAMAPRPGAAFIAFPQDVQKGATTVDAPPMVSLPPLGPAPATEIAKAAEKIKNAKHPVLLLGMGASEPKAAAAVRAFLKRSPLPVAGTFQGTGSHLPRTGESVLRESRTFPQSARRQSSCASRRRSNRRVRPRRVRPEAWNAARRTSIIHIDDYPCEIDNHYQPEIELRGSVEDTLTSLAQLLNEKAFAPDLELQSVQAEWRAFQNPAAPINGRLVHPLSFVLALRKLVDDDTVIASDMGSHHIWMARHFFEFEPRKLLFSDGQQTLGVGIPWAMAASILQSGKKVVATVGDGGFLYSSMELETAVREKLNLTVFVFRDGGYNMVAVQQELQFGRTSGVVFGNPDLVKYAESMGCVGLRVESPDQLERVMQKGLETPGVVIVDIPTDYSKNVEIGQHLLPDAWN